MLAENGAACEEPLLSNFTQILCYPPKKFIRIVHEKTEKCDRICEKVMEVIKCNFNLEITPIARTLFGLRCKRNKLWVPDSHTLQHEELYEFRLRFKIPQMSELKNLNAAAYEYFFYQLSYDLLNGDLNDIDYSEKRNTILGLCVTDMCIHRLKSNITNDEIMLKYTDYLPKQIYRFTLFWPFKAVYDYYIKRTIKGCLDNQVHLPPETGYLSLMELYVEGILSLSQYYSNETYTAYIEDELNLGEIKVKIMVQPFDKEEPGLCIKHSYGRIEKLCDIRDICEIDYNDKKYLNLYTNKDVIHSIRFESLEELESFVSCVSMYFRLICNWTINLCTKLEFPSLIFLKKLKCHGPIEKELSKQKLEQAPLSDLKDGVFLVRQSEKLFGTLEMDVLNWERKILETFIIKMIEVNGENVEHQYVVLSPIDLEPLGCYSRLEEIAEESVPRCECIGPSYFDKSLRLLLCYSPEEPKGLNKNDDIFTQISPIIEKENLSQIFDIFQADTGDNADYKIFDLRRGTLKIPSPEKLIDVSIKSLKPNRIQFMSELLDNAFILKQTSQSLSFMVKYYGFTLQQPSVFVMERLVYGRLSKYLRNYRHRIQFDNLIDICMNLSKALNHIQTNAINYGKLRCSCLYVTGVSTTGRIHVKLGDPILPKSYTTKDLAWVPMEYRQIIYKNQEQFRKAFCNVAIIKERDQRRDIEETENCTDLIRSDPTVLVWAYGTTIWEIFSYGNVIGKDLNLGLLSAPHLPVPDSCTSYPQIESIMVSCWQTKKQARIGFLNIQTMWNKIVRNLKSLPTPALPDANEDSCNSSEDEDEIIRNIFLDKGKVQPEVPSRLKFNDYTITFKEKIDGNGNFSFLYRGEMADAKGEEREVALKCLKKFRNALDFEKFRREATLMKDLQHPNIVTIYGFYEDIPYLNSIIIMEFLSAGSLDDYVQKNHLPKNVLLKFAADIARGMAYLEVKKIIHCDLAARNVLVADANNVKVADFGLSVAKRNTDGKNSEVCTYGAYNWLAPEVLAEKPHSFKSDVWAYGVTLYEIFAASEPDYGIEEIENLLEYLKTSNRLSTHWMDDAISESLIKPCWRFEASERPTYEDILRTIADLL